MSMISSPIQAPLSTIPATFSMSSQETWPLTFETAAVVGAGTPSSPVITMTDLGTGHAVTLSDAATLFGTQITQ